MALDILEFDLTDDIDAADRVERRVAHGVYRIFHNKRDIGQELWGMFKLKAGGYRLMSEIELQWPVENKQWLRYDLSDEWEPLLLWTQIDVDGMRRFSTYAPGAAEAFDISIYEQSIQHAEQNDEVRKTTGAMKPVNGVKPTTDKMRPIVPPRQIFNQALPRTSTTCLDYGSTLMNLAQFRMLQLSQGESAAMTALIPSQPSLMPITVDQTCTFTRVEDVSSVLDGFTSARRYVITEEGESAPHSTLWTDEHDVVLRQEIMFGTESHGCELVSYTWHG
jgi:hypothetical protein